MEKGEDGEVKKAINGTSQLGVMGLNFIIFEFDLWMNLAALRVYCLFLKNA